MVTLTIKEKTFDVNRIVSFGCSFTAGTEILDYQLDPYFVKLKHKLDAYQWWQAIQQDKKQSRLLDQLRLQERNHAWPAKLAAILGVEWLNLAHPGNSNEHATWEVEHSLISNQLRDTDLVIVGLTNMQRSMFFSSTHPAPVNFLFSNKGSYSHVLTENILKWFTDDRILWEYYKDLKGFKFLKDKLNGRLFVVPTDNTIRDICPDTYTHMYGTFEPCSRDNAEFFSKVINQMRDSDLFLTFEHCLYKFQNEKTRLPHGHLNEDAHRSFAELLYKEHITTSTNNLK